MNIWQTIQGVNNLSIGCNYLCTRQSNTTESNVSIYNQSALRNYQMHVLNQSEIIPIRSSESFPSSCKKKTISNKSDGTASPPHGGKKRCENHNSQINGFGATSTLQAPWIMRNYCAGMIGLHEEIEDFYNYIRPSEEESNMREHVIKSVKIVVQQLWPAAELDVFGSFRTNLYLPTSDIDMVLFGEWEYLPLWTLKEALITNRLADERSIKVLDRAAVPIIKFEHLDTNVKVDISFNTKSGVQSVQLVKSFTKFETKVGCLGREQCPKEEFEAVFWECPGLKLQKYGKPTQSTFISSYPALPKLIFVLKQFLVIRELNEVWTGGVSSYSLLLMCVSFLQRHPRFDARLPDVNLGVLLIEFFELYGKYFNYHTTRISVENGGRYIKKEDQMDNGSMSSLLSIQDPLTLGNDLGRGSYQMPLVKNAFDYAYRALTDAVINHKYSRGANYQAVSLLSLIVSIRDSTIANRTVARERWRGHVTARSVSLDTNEILHPPRCSTASSACSSVSSSDVVTFSPLYTSSEELNTSTDSDFEDHADDSLRRSEVATKRSPEIVHRAKSADYLSKLNFFVDKSRKPQNRNCSPVRTHSADSNRRHPRKSHLPPQFNFTGATTNNDLSVKDDIKLPVSLPAKSTEYYSYSNAVKLKAPPSKKATKQPSGQQNKIREQQRNSEPKENSRWATIPKNNKQTSRPFSRNPGNRKSGSGQHRHNCGNSQNRPLSSPSTTTTNHSYAGR